MKQNSQYRIIGIDPGLRLTGWGIIDYHNNKLIYLDSGVITSCKKDSLTSKIHYIHTELDNIIKKYQPNIAAIEETFINNNNKSSLILGHARGGILLGLALNNLPVYEYATRLIKKTVSGNGKADKNQIKKMIEYLLVTNKIKKEITYDETDALATAICYTSHQHLCEY